MITNKFIVKLLQMMKQFPQIINWSQDGSQIEIFDVQKFSTQVHTRYFTSSNYQSFLRQLNMYNFRKMSKRKNSVSFRHEDFRRDNSQHFHDIRRRKQKSLKRDNALQDRDAEDISLSSATNSTINLDPEMRQTLALIRKEVSLKGLALLQRLEQLLQKSQSQTSLASQCRLTDQISTVNFREYGSFCKMEDKDYHCTSNSEFNFESQIFHQGAFLEE